MGGDRTAMNFPALEGKRMGCCSSGENGKQILGKDPKLVNILKSNRSNKMYMYIASNLS